jgi:hypothetical protein
MASALLLQLGALTQSTNSGDIHVSALNFYYQKRGSPRAKDEFLSPSQIRFIKFFSDCLDAGIVTPSVILPNYCSRSLSTHMAAGYIASSSWHAHR